MLNSTSENGTGMSQLHPKLTEQAEEAAIRKAAEHHHHQMRFKADWVKSERGGQV